MKWDPISRRHFLRGLGGATLALPFLPSLLTPEAYAQSVSVAPRFLAFWTPHGGPSPTHRLPAQVPNIPVASTSGHTVHYMQNPQNFSALFGAPFNPLLSRMTCLANLDVVQYIAHQRAGLLGDLNLADNATGPVEHIATIDQVMAYDPGFYPSAPAVRSLAVNPSGSGSISFRWNSPATRSGGTTEVSALNNPQALFNSIFGTGQMGAPRDSGIIDSVYEDYTMLKSNSRMSTEDRHLLDDHLTFLSDLRGRLTAGANCTGTSRPSSITLWDDATSARLQMVSQLLIDVVVAALRCGMTRIATFRLDYLLYVSDFHTEAHESNVTANQNSIVERYRWFAENVLLYLLQRMEAVTESNGRTMLDNSIVMWGSENLIPHTNKSQIIHLWGSAGGRLTSPGKYIDYSDRNTQYQNGYVMRDNTIERILRPGYLYNRLLSTLLQVMGVPPERYELPRTGDYSYGGYGSVYPTQSNWGGGMSSDFALMSNFYPPQFPHMNTPLPLLTA